MSTPTVEGVRVDCTCPRARHRHGDRRAYLYDGCRCAPCRAANAQHAREYRYEVARRRWSGASAWTNSTGTRRRLQALAAAGWSLTELAPHLDVGSSGVGWLRAVQGDCLTITAQRVADVYEQLWHTTPTGRAVERTARWAARRGWVEPWQWIGVDIDDPAAQPAEAGDELDEIAIAEAMLGRRVRLTSAEQTEAVRRLTGNGVSGSAIAQLLHVSIRTVERRRAAA